MTRLPNGDEAVEAWTEYAIEWDDGPSSGPSYTVFGQDKARAKLLFSLYGFKPKPGKIVECTVIRTEWRDLEHGDHV